MTATDDCSDSGLLQAYRLDGDEAAFVSVLKVTIPKKGQRFVLALFSSTDPTPEKPYEFRLVRTEGLRFQASDLYLFNVTQLLI